MDMRYYWIQYRIKQGQFDVSWAPCDTNLGDYFTKHHSPAHHKRIQPFYIHIQTAPMIRHNTKKPVLRGCVNLCTLSQTVNRPLPSLGPRPHDFTGGHMHSEVPTLRPPIPAQARATKIMRPYPKCATQQHHTIAQCAYARRQASSCRTQQHPTIVQCAYAQHQSVSHTPASHYGSARSHTPPDSLVYHRLFPRSGLTYTHCNTH
jgi:hypothetical protein